MEVLSLRASLGFIHCHRDILSFLSSMQAVGSQGNVVLNDEKPAHPLLPDCVPDYVGNCSQIDRSQWNGDSHKRRKCTSPYYLGIQDNRPDVCLPNDCIIRWESYPLRLCRMTRILSFFCSFSFLNLKFRLQVLWAAPLNSPVRWSWSLTLSVPRGLSQIWQLSAFWKEFSSFTLRFIGTTFDRIDSF